MTDPSQEARLIQTLQFWDGSTAEDYTNHVEGYVITRVTKYAGPDGCHAQLWCEEQGRIFKNAMEHTKKHLLAHLKTSDRIGLIPRFRSIK